jgi:hypothetical protein
MVGTVCGWAPAGWAVAEWLRTWRLTFSLRSNHTMLLPRTHLVPCPARVRVLYAEPLFRANVTNVQGNTANVTNVRRFSRAPRQTRNVTIMQKSKHVMSQMCELTFPFANVTNVQRKLANVTDSLTNVRISLKSYPILILCSVPSLTKSLLTQ